jgi:hypothetical protein
MDSITALQRQRDQSRGLIAEETITAQQTSSCATVTVTADDSGNGGDDTNPGGGNGGDDTSPVPGGVGTSAIAIAGGIGLLGVLLLLLN